MFRAPQPFKSHRSQGALHGKLEQLLDTIDTAYRNASTPDPGIESLLLVASPHVSQRNERLSGKRQQRKTA
jgi:hypothetical protein